MGLELILLVVLIIALIGMLPGWGYSRGWNMGYTPSGIISVILIVWLISLIIQKRKLDIEREICLYVYTNERKTSYLLNTWTRWQ